MVPKMALIRRNGGLNMRFFVRDPEKAHSCTEPRVLAYFASKIRPWALAVASCKNPPPQKKKTNTFRMCNLASKVTHARKGNAWVNRDELLHRCRGPRRNHLCQFLWFPLTGFERGGGSNFGLLHWLASSPLQHSRTTVRVCDVRFPHEIIVL